jgi:hypothetical protein
VNRRQFFAALLGASVAAPLLPSGPTPAAADPLSFTMTLRGPAAAYQSPRLSMAILAMKPETTYSIDLFADSDPLLSFEEAKG